MLCLSNLRFVLRGYFPKNNLDSNDNHLCIRCSMKVMSDNLKRYDVMHRGEM